MLTLNTAAETKNIPHKVRESISDKIRERKPKLLQQVRITLRTMHYSGKTEEAYINWIKQFIIYSNKQHPDKLDNTHVSKFLSHLTVDRHVSSSTREI